MHPFLLQVRHCMVFLSCLSWVGVADEWCCMSTASLATMFANVTGFSIGIGMVKFV